VALDRVNVIRGAAVADHLSVREADARAHQLGEPLRLVPSYLSAGIVRLRVEEKSAERLVNVRERVAGVRGFKPAPPRHKLRTRIVPVIRLTMAIALGTKPCIDGIEPSANPIDLVLSTLRIGV